MEVLRQIFGLVVSLGLENDLREWVANGKLDDAVLLRHADGWVPRITVEAVTG